MDFDLKLKRIWRKVYASFDGNFYKKTIYVLHQNMADVFNVMALAFSLKD